MPRHRQALPNLHGKPFLTDGGLETTLIFHEGFELPCFAAFPLLNSAEGRRALDEYYRRYAAIARDHGMGFVLESVTWRASRDWGRVLGYSEDALVRANREAIEMLVALRDELAEGRSDIVISGCVGPRGDGYVAGTTMTPAEAEAYHRFQVGIFAETEADMVSVITMTYAEEAIGVVRAANAFGMPVAVSFTVETDGRLPSGEELGAAIERVDGATGGAAAYYMVNCAHPTHFSDQLDAERGWARRIHGVRANASTRSHAELDEATELDDGDPIDLGQRYLELRQRLPNLNVLGGCCGTDHRHVEAIARAWSRGEAA